MHSVRTRVTFEDLVATISSAPRGASSDLHMLERYYRDVIADRLSDEALLFYGIHIEPEETKYLLALLEIASKRGLLPQIRLRPGIDRPMLQNQLRLLRENRNNVGHAVGKDLHTAYEPVCEVSELLSELVRQLHEHHEVAETCS